MLTLGIFLLEKYFLLNPYASGIISLVILVNILFDDLSFSFLYLFFSSILLSYVFDFDFQLLITSLISGSTAIFLSINARRRNDILKAAFISSLIELITLIIFISLSLEYNLLSLRTTLYPVLIHLATCIPIVVVLPFFEYLFGVITNISLLELSDFNHPLLRRMILEAPGTYRHSLEVAHLAEAAAEAIRANSLLARVGAYYHDIGKLAKPEYFSENQMLATYRDRHKRLTPSMSKLIIMNHIKEGIELAKKFRLNPRIIDFISQHHGTTLVYYFFKRAQQTKPQDAEPEENYRYPGPKPHSKEVAIVHLADTVEARSRSLEDPTPARLKEIVKESIVHKFLDGQLDESELTLRDLEKIAEVFTRTLNAMFHTRINYPKPEENENIYKQLSKFNKNKNNSF